MTNVLYYLHFLIPLTVILMPLLPNKYLIYVFPYPIIYYFIWLIFNGCPLSKISQKNMKDKDNFILPLFKKYVHKDITESQMNNIINIIISSSIIISAYKLLYKCKYKFK
jgi:hypothetical protein